MNRNEAQGLVEAVLSNNAIDCLILEGETIEREWGWVFFYQSKKYIETGDDKEMLIGNAPYIINRTTGIITPTGTAHAIEDYIQEYEASL